MLEKNKFVLSVGFCFCFSFFFLFPFSYKMPVSRVSCLLTTRGVFLTPVHHAFLHFPFSLVISNLADSESSRKRSSFERAD